MKELAHNVQAAETAERFSLRKFLNAYVEHLERAGRFSFKDAANIFKNHLFNDAVISARAASLASTEDFVALISKVVAALHGRTAEKLRSYLYAAYALGIRAKTNLAASQAIRQFGIQGNPLASIDAMAQFNKAHVRKLSVPELAASLHPV